MKKTCSTCGGDVGINAFGRHERKCKRDAKQPFGVPKKKVVPKKKKVNQ